MPAVGTFPLAISSCRRQGPAAAALPVTSNFTREDEIYKASTIVILVLMLSWIGTSAHAQTPPRQEEQELAPSSRLNLTLEQRHVIREIIKDMKTDAGPRDVQVKVGQAIPQGVSPRPMPADVAQKVPQVKTHSFFVTALEIVIVDPKDNNVAEVIKLGAD